MLQRVPDFFFLSVLFCVFFKLCLFSPTGKREKIIKYLKHLKHVKWVRNGVQCMTLYNDINYSCITAYIHAWSVQALTL